MEGRESPLSPLTATTHGHGAVVTTDHLRPTRHGTHLHTSHNDRDLL